jgi:succinate dehydrogenase flavin-adding protein (antitoxin of CptAB toxin-antitoxin module)
MLERYARERLPAQPPSQRRLFARLLALPDPVLVDYLLGHQQPSEPAMAQLVRLIARAD